MMLLLETPAQHVDQFRIIDGDSFSRRRLNIDHQVCKVSRDGIRAHALRFSQIDRPRRLIRVAKSRSISQHLALFSPGEVGKSFWTGRTLESEKTVAVNARVSREHLVELLAAHTFDRITPKAFHCCDDTHSNWIFLAPNHERALKRRSNSINKGERSMAKGASTGDSVVAIA